MSIQGLIFIPEPVFNEPGYETIHGEEERKVSEYPCTCIYHYVFGITMCNVCVCVHDCVEEELEVQCRCPGVHHQTCHGGATEKPSCW